MPRDVMGPVPSRPDTAPMAPPLASGVRHQVISDVDAIKAFNNLGLLHDALDLVMELWPKPGYRTVTLETHQWVKLRRVLLAIPDLVATDE